MAQQKKHARTLWSILSPTGVRIPAALLGFLALTIETLASVCLSGVCLGVGLSRHVPALMSERIGTDARLSYEVRQIIVIG